MIGAYYEISPLDSTGILLVATPIIAVGWLWIGAAWLRSPRAPRRDLAATTQQPW